MKTKIFLIVLPAALIVHAWLYLTPRGEGIENYFLDLWFQLRGPVAASNDVLLVAMDENSYQNLNVPLDEAWPRALHTKLLNKLKQLGARKVVFDVLFLGASADAAVDQAFAQAIAQIPTVLSIDYGKREQDGYELTEILYPHQPFFEKAKESALAGLPEDYGYVRRFLVPNVEEMDDLRPLAQAAASDISTSLNYPGERELINFFGPAGSISRLSYDQVLETDPPLPRKLIEDKVIFVGLALRSGLGPQQKDAFLTPFPERGRTFGVEIHATATANLLNGNWIRRASLKTELWILSFLLAGMVTLLFTARPLRGSFYLLSSIATWFLCSNFCFRSGLFIPGASSVLIVMPSTYMISTFYYYITTRRAQRQIQRAFEFYISPEMARTVSRDPQALKLGGKNEIATVMFTDIAGFSRISETLPAEQVASMLNAYFTEVMDVIFEKDGTLIKFIGDAAFAIWGAPVRTKDHARKACETAVRIQEEVVRFNNSNRFPPLHTRIGIHTGPMVVGNLGSARRFDFTAVGDAVNLCSRIEGINKYLGTTILISDTVANTLSGEYSPLSMGSIQPAGKEESVELFTLLTPKVDSTAEELWQKAVSYFKQRMWEESQKAFQLASELEPRLHDPALFFCDQIQTLRGRSVKSDWKGEIVLSEK